jgi:serine/threonine protein kinase
MTSLCPSFDDESRTGENRPVGRRSEMSAGDVIGGRYVLLHELGCGGMGQVWSARNEWTGAEVAVKALAPRLASSPEALALLGEEARATARLAHRSIVRVFDLVELHPGSGRLLIVMELLRGHSLAQRLDALGPLSIEQTLGVALPILSALSHAHGAGIVHRDVKPENVFLALEPDGGVIPKLLDFGVSQTREWGRAPNRSETVVVGTRWYMSPEQARGEAVDARCDVFGVGVLIYECLTGTNPFRVEGTTRAADRRWSFPRIETIPARLWAVIARALAERREDRHASAAELADALRDAVSPSARGSTFPRVRLSARALGALDFLAMVAVAAALGFQLGVPVRSARTSAGVSSLPASADWDTNLQSK